MAKLQTTALALIFLISCAKQEMTTYSGVAMTIPYQVKVGDPITSWQKRKIDKIISREFKKIDSTFNHWNPNSKLSLYHKGSLPKLPQEMEKVLSIAEEVRELSRGRFDPSQGAMIKLWKEHLEAESEPTPEEITIAKSKVYLDFDGIIKGYAVDRITKALSKLGLNSLYVEWGGEIRCSGRHPANRPWKIASGSQVIEMESGSLATSGDSVQRWGDKTHIFNPESGKMLNCKITIRNVTVRANSCALADALATAAMLYTDKQEFEEFANRVQEHFADVTIY